ncbi:MAG: TetR/AcrR family transcriptional regulator [Actinomycetaceae bacterium]|nr:TetR/AcrR family transcriptional regulator [Actinomycetaceae bacterium]
MADKEKVLSQLTGLFIEHGYSGTTLANIANTTGLGRGSLYHMFKGGKAQMLREVFQAVSQQFEREVIAPLEDNDITKMFNGLQTFYEDGKSQSLSSLVTLDAKGGDFQNLIQDHYTSWRAALTKALLHAGVARGEAASLSERTIAGIEGALVLGAAFDDTDALSRTIRTLKTHIKAATKSK